MMLFSQVGTRPVYSVAALRVADLDVGAVMRSVRLDHRPAEVIHPVKDSVFILVPENIVVVAAVALPRFVEKKDALFFYGLVKTQLGVGAVGFDHEIVPEHLPPAAKIDRFFAHKKLLAMACAAHFSARKNTLLLCAGIRQSLACSAVRRARISEKHAYAPQTSPAIYNYSYYSINDTSCK